MHTGRKNRERPVFGVIQKDSIETINEAYYSSLINLILGLLLVELLNPDMLVTLIALKIEWKSFV
jgi:hypothetical protein